MFRTIPARPTSLNPDAVIIETPTEIVPARSPDPGTAVTIGIVRNGVEKTTSNWWSVFAAALALI